MSKTRRRSLGATDYRRYCALLGLTPDDSLTPRQRSAAIPQWMNLPLIASTAARNKLRAFVARTPQPWQTPDPAEVLTRLDFTGDTVMPHLLARLLVKLSPPVCAYAIERVQFVGAGIVTLGWCGAPTRTTRPWQIVLSGTPDDGGADRFSDLAGHEIAHCWLLPEPASDTRPAGAFWMQTVYELPLDRVQKLKPSALAAVQRSREEACDCERECLRLTRAWGLRDVGAEARA